MDIALLVHFSNELEKDDYQKILDFMKQSLQYAGLDDGSVRVGAAVFRKRGIPLFDFNQYQDKQQLFDGIDQISFNYR